MLGNYLTSLLLAMANRDGGIESLCRFGRLTEITSSFEPPSPRLSSSSDVLPSLISSDNCRLGQSYSFTMGAGAERY